MDRAKQIEEYVVKIFKAKYVHGDDYYWVEPESIFNIIFRDFPNFLSSVCRLIQLLTVSWYLQTFLERKKLG